MKKLRLIFIYLILACSVCSAFVLFAGCSAPPLEAPTGLKFVDNNTLVWDVVSHAKGYVVDIDGVATETRRNTASARNLAVGEHTVRVKAVGDGDKYGDSEWATLAFTKAYESGMIYSLTEDGGAYVVENAGTASGDIVIEDEYKGLPIIGVGEKAFANSSTLTSVVIGKNVKEIGSAAFYNCSLLTEATIQNGVTVIGVQAFQSCRGLTTLDIPDSVNTIDESAFAYCRGLTEVNLGNGVVTIGERAFYNCNGLVELNIPKSVRSLGAEAFGGAEGLTSARIDGTDAAIGASAFSGCKNLSDIELTDGVGSIGSRAFESCESLKSIVIPFHLNFLTAIVLFLLDIAVRKFKWKWIHEIVRERKEARSAVSDERDATENL